MSKSIVCPSGLAGEIRGLTGREGKLLTNKQAHKNGTIWEQILEAAWVSTSDFGPYQQSNSGKPNWDEVLVGDRFFILLQIRILTYGEDYSFDLRCESCEDKFNVIFSLDDLTVEPLSDADRNTFLNGNRFVAEIPSTGQKAVYRLPTGADEKKAQKLLRGENQELVTALNFRIQEIEDVTPFKKKQFLEDLPLGDFPKILAQFDEHDCGVDTEITVCCSSCGSDQDVRLPFDHQFWIPKAKK